MAAYFIGGVIGFLIGVVISSILLASKNVQKMEQITDQVADNIKDSGSLVKAAYNAYLNADDSTTSDKENEEDTKE